MDKELFMLRTLPQTRDLSQVERLAAIAAFTLLSVIAARISIPLEPVPFTMQVLSVLLAGMVLGARDGALSQVGYLGLIALNLPVDARMIGAAAFSGGTVGFLFGFVVAAFITGLLVERAGTRWWQRWLAGIVGIVVIYACGIVGLSLVRGMDLVAAAGVVAPLLPLDLAKAAIAAAATEGARSLFLFNQPKA
jgi:biotin transport system substrate-specific component